MEISAMLRLLSHENGCFIAFLIKNLLSPASSMFDRKLKLKCANTYISVSFQTKSVWEITPHHASNTTLAGSTSCGPNCTQKCNCFVSTQMHTFFFFKPTKGGLTLLNTCDHYRIWRLCVTNWHQIVTSKLYSWGVKQSRGRGYSVDLGFGDVPRKWVAFSPMWNLFFW